jgi:hypothetical protein
MLPILHVIARECAELKGHQSPGEHATRAARAVELICGVRYDERLKLPKIPLAGPWQALADHVSGRDRGKLAFLANCCAVAGFVDRAPAEWPEDLALQKAAESLRPGDVSNALACLTQSKGVYRAARLRLLQDNADQELLGLYLPIRRTISSKTSHLGAEEGTYALLEQRGLIPEDMTPEQMLRAVFPTLAGDYDFWANADDGLRSSTAHLVGTLQTLIRVAGWLVRAADTEVKFHGAETAETLRSRFAMLGLDDLFTGVAHVDEAAGVIGRDAQRRGISAKSKSTRTLLHHLVEREAPDSLRRSPLLDPGIDFESVRSPSGWYLTDSLYFDCSKLWNVAVAIYREELLHGDPDDNARWVKVEGNWAALSSVFTKRQLPLELCSYIKDKNLMIRTVTLPQLVCLGFPLRRIEIRALREQWTDAREKAVEAGHDPDLHPTVREAAGRYFTDAVVPHLMSSLSIEDGMRKKQYVHGRPGSHFIIELERDSCGKPIGIKGLSTCWLAAKGDTARVKNWERKKGLNERKLRDVRPGYVDFAMLWDFLSYQRPLDLLSSLAIPSLDEYDLESDLLNSPWPLFVSPSPVTDRTSQTRRDGSWTDFTEQVGQELHHAVRLFRPELPSWEEVSADPKWRHLWTTHVGRMLTASYWGGIRDRWDIAMYLTMDTERTLKGEYSVVAHELKDKLGMDERNWENPAAYNAWMDRLYFHRDVFDPLLDPDLPLPESLLGKVEAYRVARARKTKRSRGSIRIRKARPGQPPPSRVRSVV